jgi:hypothetical protein
MKGNVLPSANITYNLGSSTQRWNDLWLANSTIYIGNAQLSANATSLILTNPGGGETVLAGASAGVTGATVSATGNVTGGNILTGGLISATGNITGSYILGNGSLLTGIDATSIQNGTSNVRVVSSGGNVAIGIGGTGNVAVLATTGLYVTGVSSVSGNITTGGSVNAGNITIAADLISSLGDTITIDPYNVGNTGHVIINGNLQVNGTTTTINSNVVSTNDLTVNYANNAINSAAANGGGIEVGPIGGAFITWLYNSTSNVWVSSLGISAVGNITGGNILGGANVNATTHTGTTVSVTGNITSGNLVTGGLISATGNITGGNLSGTSIVGTLTTAAQTNITSVGTLGSLAVTGNTTSGNFVGTLNGSGANVTSISATNISSGTLAQARLANAAVTLGSTALTLGSTVTTVAGLTSVTSTTFVGALTGAATSATTAGTVTTAAQPNITSVGTLTGLTINNATTAITNGAANGVGNIGTSANSFNTVFAKATSAQYADLAEMYVADADYLPGTVLEFGGNHEVTISNTANSSLIAGVVSTNPAHLMNSTAQGKYLAAIALVGRVPTLVIGPVSKGAMMVSAGNGHAQASATPAMGTVIGKAVEDFTGESGTIEIAVGRL